MSSWSFILLLVFCLGYFLIGVFAVATVCYRYNVEAPSENEYVTVVMLWPVIIVMLLGHLILQLWDKLREHS